MSDPKPMLARIMEAMNSYGTTRFPRFHVVYDRRAPGAEVVIVAEFERETNARAECTRLNALAVLEELAQPDNDIISTGEAAMILASTPRWAAKTAWRVMIEAIKAGCPLTTMDERTSFVARMLSPAVAIDAIKEGK